MNLFSPAKINFFLRILHKRLDGYHELASLFQAIDLGDTLTLFLAKEDRLTCSEPTIPCSGQNLVAKAVELFRRKSGLSFRASIHIEKKIPIQAGLGGGSSNAATTLWGLNALHDFLYSEQELQEWSAEIGSDIPFFFSHGTAYCTGRGEQVQDLQPLQGVPSFQVIKPAEGCSTPDVYRELRLSECAPDSPDTLLNEFCSGRFSFINDLEIPAFRVCPALSGIKEKLIKEGHRQLFMSGSGTAFISLREGPHRIMNREPGQWYPS